MSAVASLRSTSSGGCRRILLLRSPTGRELSAFPARTATSSRVLFTTAASGTSTAAASAPPARLILRPRGPLPPLRRLQPLRTPEEVHFHHGHARGPSWGRRKFSSAAASAPPQGPKKGTPEGPANSHASSPDVDETGETAAPSWRGPLLTLAVGAVVAYFTYDRISDSNYQKLKQAFERPSFVFDWDPSRWSQVNEEELFLDIGRREIILVRHGQYHMRTTGDESRTLTDLGKEQAKLTGERLFNLLHADGLFPLRRPNCTIKVYQSSLTRAKETADILLEAMNESMRKVVKTHNSRITGRSTEAQAAPQTPTPVDPDAFELAAITDPAIAEGLPCIPDPDPQKGKRDTKAPNAKSSQQRIEKAFDTVFRIPQGSDVEHIATQIYVCHANVIRYFLLRALQLDERAWLRLSVAHASIVWISVDHDGYVSCRLVGDAGHLPVEKLTY